MYAAVGNTRLLDEKGRREQWLRAVGSLQLAAHYAAERSVKLAVEPLNRFETDLGRSRRARTRSPRMDSSTCAPFFNDS